MIKNKKIIFSVLVIISLAGLNVNVNAQWSFSFTLKVSGTCGSYTPQIPTFNIPYMPDKATCENIRQQILALSATGDGCTASYTATACTGSDATSPGSVSIDGLVSGNPFFSPHDTKSLENWINDFALKLKSMGITIDEDNFMTAQDIPLTGVEDFDKKYTDETLRFEYPEQGGVVDLRGSSAFEGKVVDINNTSSTETSESSPVTGTVSSLKSGYNDEAAAEFNITQSWNMAEMKDNTIEDTELPSSEDNSSYKFDLLTFTVGKLGGELQAEIGSWEKSVADVSLDNIKNAASSLAGNTSVSVYDEKGVLVKASANYIADKAKELGLGYFVSGNVSKETLDAGGDASFGIKSVKQAANKWLGN